MVPHRPLYYSKKDISGVYGQLFQIALHISELETRRLVWRLFQIQGPTPSKDRLLIQKHHIDPYWIVMPLRMRRLYYSTIYIGNHWNVRRSH